MSLLCNHILYHDDCAECRRNDAYEASQKEADLAAAARLRDIAAGREPEVSAPKGPKTSKWWEPDPAGSDGVLHRDALKRHEMRTKADQDAREAVALRQARQERSEAARAALHLDAARERRLALAEGVTLAPNLRGGVFMNAFVAHVALWVLATVTRTSGLVPFRFIFPGGIAVLFAVAAARGFDRSRLRRSDQDDQWGQHGSELTRVATYGRAFTSPAMAKWYLAWTALFAVPVLLASSDAALLGLAVAQIVTIPMLVAAVTLRAQEIWSFREVARF